MNINYLHHTIFFLGIALAVISCQHEPIVQPFCEEASPTYSDTIQTIVNLSCSYSGCHASGAGFGDFTTYNGMLSRLDDGKIRDRVLDKKDDTSVGMPPNYATGGPIDLTAEELELFECWLDNNYPQ